MSDRELEFTTHEIENMPETIDLQPNRMLVEVFLDTNNNLNFKIYDNIVDVEETANHYLPFIAAGMVNAASLHLEEVYRLGVECITEHVTNTFEMPNFTVKDIDLSKIKPRGNA